MQFVATPLAIPDAKIIAGPVIPDSRGYLAVTYNAVEFRRMGLPEFVQDNQALSTRRGTIRGMHFQRPPYAQAKLVRVLRGSVFDVVVDLRAGSPTFGQWAGVTLAAHSGLALFVPRGFGHGYCTLEDDTEVAYRCDNEYAPAAEGGVLFSDPAIAIDWPVPLAGVIVSEKDRRLPLMRDFATPFQTEDA